MFFLSTARRLCSGLVFLPLEWFRYYLSLLLSWMIYVASMVGIRPKGYIPASKLTDLNRIIEHLYAQEDLYRKAIRELKEEIDAKDTDRKKAMKKLKHTKEEIAVLSESLSMLRQQYEKDDMVHHAEHEGAAPAHGGGAFFVHASFCVLVCMLWLFSRIDGGVLEWKIVMSVLFPISWMYVSQVVQASSVGTMVVVLLLCSMWAMIGFIGSLLISSNSVSKQSNIY